MSLINYINVDNDSKDKIHRTEHSEQCQHNCSIYNNYILIIYNYYIYINYIHI